VAYSIGRPFRKGFWTNRQYTLALLVTAVCSFWLMFHPDPFTKWLFTLPEWTAAFKFVLIVLALLNFLIGWSSERFLIVGILGESEGLQP
jgi:magnesium-transporting ATPase (P-type)